MTTLAVFSNTDVQLNVFYHCVVEDPIEKDNSWTQGNQATVYLRLPSTRLVARCNAFASDHLYRQRQSDQKVPGTGIWTRLLGHVGAGKWGGDL
jgi:hypothetical protein